MVWREFEKRILGWLAMVAAMPRGMLGMECIMDAFGVDGDTTWMRLKQAITHGRLDAVFTLLFWRQVEPDCRVSCAWIRTNVQ